MGIATDNGKLAINVRYGARMLELAKGKFAIEVASEKELVPTLEALKTIAASGELDALEFSESVGDNRCACHYGLPRPVLSRTTAASAAISTAASAASSYGVEIK